MDNSKLVIGIVVAVAVFFGAPFAMRALRPVAAPAAAVQSPANLPAQPQTQMQQPQAGMPALTAQTLVGTLWEVSAKQGTIKFQFNAGGQGVGMHPFLGQIPATWTCSGNQVNVTASPMGQTMAISAQIQGNNLVGQGCTIRRLQ